MKALRQARAGNKEGKLPGGDKLAQAESTAAMQRLLEGSSGKGDCPGKEGGCPGDGKGGCPGPGGGCPGGGKGQGGGGTGGQQGGGGQPPEGPDKGGNFIPEKAASQLVAGKLLMQWKIREVAHRGEMKREYDDAVEAVIEGVGEAIERERVPPGYHDTIKEYFRNESFTTEPAGDAREPAPVPPADEPEVP
jgi:hypothetical protein